MSLVMGILLLVAGRPLWKWARPLFSQSLSTNETLGTLEPISENVYIKRPNSTQFEIGKAKTPLGNFFRIRTASQGTTHIVFTSGDRVFLEEDTEVVLERPEWEGNRTSILIHLVRGRASSVQSPQNSIIEIVDQELDQMGFQSSNQLLTISSSLLPQPVETSTSPQPSPQIVAKPRETPLKETIRATKNSDTLSDSYIFSIIQGQRSLFKRCYLQHIKKDPRSQGTMRLSFTIQPSGEVSETEVMESSIPDETLKRCVQRVLSRARFKSFKSDPIIAQYPLTFE